MSAYRPRLALLAAVLAGCEQPETTTQASFQALLLIAALVAGIAFIGWIWARRRAVAPYAFGALLAVLLVFALILFAMRKVVDAETRPVVDAPGSTSISSR
jgi:predicted neutral ceramidase superfamily lipid hydrolase